MTSTPLLADRAAVVEVFYGTDRARDDITVPERFYGSRRGEVEFGRVLVEVPLDDPLIDFDRLDPRRLVLKEATGWRPRMEAVEPESADRFYTGLDAALVSAGESSMLVYIHGYKRRFDEAVVSLAELKLRTGYRGAVVLWSWPSVNQTAGYVADYTNAQWSMPNLAEFLAGLSDKTRASRFDIVAHSMGGRMVTELLATGVRVGRWRYPRLDRLVLLAPDVDADIFKRDLAPWLGRVAIETTLYASANDMPLHTSRMLHDYRRAGDSTDSVTVAPGVETVDVSTVNRSFMGHRYFEESEAVISDLAQLLVERLPAERRRGLVRIEAGADTFWAITPSDQ